MVGDPKANTLLAIKRVSLQRKSKVKLAFQAPSKMATHHLVLYFMCDSYMGCDQVLRRSSPCVKPTLNPGCRFMTCSTLGLEAMAERGSANGLIARPCPI